MGDEPLSGVIPAHINGFVCPQATPKSMGGPTLHQNSSEDCLVLNILIPASAKHRQLPVLVQIHGGGYAQWHLDEGDGLVHMAAGEMIYVSLQYRLGMFGFLAGEEVRQGGVQNAGLLDQQAALQWIQRHITRFGGDPNQVTIWGGSAGGGSVTSHLIAYGAEKPSGLFSRAIVEFPWWQPLMDEYAQKVQYETVLGLANCTTLDCLRSRPESELIRVNADSQEVAYPSPGYGYGVYNYGPVVDGNLIRDLPSEAFRSGRFHHVPLLVDRAGLEGFIFSNASITTEEEQIIDARYLFPNSDDAFFEQLFRLYPHNQFASAFWQRQTWFGDFIINCPTYYIAKAASKFAPVYKLSFDTGTRVHGATGPFLNSGDIAYPGADPVMTRIMGKYWISFVLTGDPNALREGRAIFWRPYGVEQEVLEISDFGMKIKTDDDNSKRCMFFHSHSSIIRN
ncbi:hypothetical protein TRVA0_102S00100 [Trichomonascus vanleenenianus]|uniref:uncharacterized protein n=1 Tax=Trichomonascus vanleenenianus TaxID=2268995 RepID=UPI003ECAA84A